MVCFARIASPVNLGPGHGGGKYQVQVSSIKRACRTIFLFLIHCYLSLPGGRRLLDPQDAAAEVFALRHGHEHGMVRRLVAEFEHLHPALRVGRGPASMARNSASCTWCEQL